MGRRSRKRLGEAAEHTRAAHARRARERTEGGEAAASAPQVRRRPRMSEAPKAPWSPFPLVELCVLGGIILCVWGLLSHGARGRGLLAFGLTLVSLASLELAIREHFAGYRSHSSLLAGACAVVLDAALCFLTALPPIVLLAAGAAAFAVAFGALRGAFMRRTGGVGFRA